MHDDYRGECNSEQCTAASIGQAGEGYEVSEQGQVEVTIRYRDVEKTIRGNPEDVFRGVFQFLSEIIPALDVV